MADVLVEVPAYTDKVHYEGLERPLLPGGSLFEQSVLLLGDSLVIPISEREGIPTDRMFALHANLE
jgi:6-phospho-3-hexuloisomerase